MTRQSKVAEMTRQSKLAEMTSVKNDGDDVTTKRWKR